MNYDASNANSDNIDVNRTDISKNSNRVIAPERSQRTRDFDNVLHHGGNWENHPCGEYVLLCREHLDRIEHIIGNCDRISNNLPTDLPLGKLHEKVNTAFKQSLKLYQSICDIIELYNNPTIRAQKIMNVSTRKERQTTHCIHMSEGVVSR